MDTHKTAHDTQRSHIGTAFPWPFSASNVLAVVVEMCCRGCFLMITIGMYSYTFKHDLRIFLDRCVFYFPHMGVSKNNGKTPQIIHLFIGFSLIFTIHFGGKNPPIFGSTPKNISRETFPKKKTSPTKLWISPAGKSWYFAIRKQAPAPSLE